MDGNALCRPCAMSGETPVFGVWAGLTALLPDGAGQEKYSTRARAVLALSRYYLSVPLYRFGRVSSDGVACRLRMRRSGITSREVADWAYPVFDHLKTRSVQGEVIYQDDTHVRILSLIAANRQALSCGLITIPAERTRECTPTAFGRAARCTGQSASILPGRAHAGENLAALLTAARAGPGESRW